MAKPRATSDSTSTGGDYEVAIVGYGPTGVTLANFLGSFGIRTLVIERERELYARARAVTVDGKTIRQFQALGLDDALKADMDVTPAVRWKTYDGRELLRTTFTEGPMGHASSYMIFQPALEATLRSAVDQYDGLVDVRFGELRHRIRRGIECGAPGTRRRARGNDPGANLDRDRCQGHPLVARAPHPHVLV